MSKGLDSPKSLIDRAGHLAQGGYTWAARYVFDHSSFKDLLTRAEAAALSTAGLWIVSVWENGSPTVDAYFTQAQGGIDGAHAARRAQGAGQPDGTVIYFAADGDIDPDRAVEYFAGVRAGLRGAGSTYAAGVYGSGAVCEAVHDQGLASHTWLSQSRGWRGYETEVAHADIVQGAEETVLGVDVDLDVSDGSAGGWKIEA